MSRTYNIDSTRNYDIDGRTYHNTSNEARNRSQIAASRNYDIDGRNYSNAMHNTGGARIFSFKGGGSGTLSVGLFVNVLMWLAVLVIVYILYRFIYGLFLKSSAAKAVDSYNDEISKHSSNRMSNGETYISAAAWLYNELIGGTGISILKNVDEERVGEYMLTVKGSEYRQLENTFSLYCKESSPLSFAGIYTSVSLSDALLSAFDSNERLKYLSHLGLH